MTAKPEFSRPVSVGSKNDALDIEADVTERAALAERFDLANLHLLSASLDIAPDGDGLIVTGTIQARAEQACIITGDPVPQDIDEAVNLRFRPESAAPDAEELELDEEDCETLYFESDTVDLGEAVAQTMALALDPFPRSDGAEAEARAAGVLKEEDVVPDNPFAALQALKGKGDA